MSMVTATPTVEATSAEDHEALVSEASQMIQAMSRLMKQVKHALVEGLPPEAAHMGESQYRALNCLFHEGRMTAGDLAERCNVADPTMSKILKSLESNSLIERRTTPDNRRVVWVDLTPEGRAMHDEMLVHFRRAIATVLRPLTDRQLQDIIVAFRHLEGLVTAADQE